MKKSIFYRPTNGGDGSLGISFFTSAAAVALCVQHDPETYSDGNGGPEFSFDVEVPVGASVTDVIYGIDIQTNTDVATMAVENEWLDSDAAAKWLGDNPEVDLIARDSDGGTKVERTDTTTTATAAPVANQG